MKDLNMLKLTGTIYGDPKSGQGKSGTWASAKLKVQGDKYYQILPLSAYGAAGDVLAQYKKDDRVMVEGEFEQAYQKPDSKEFPRYQMKVTYISPASDRGNNPEIDDQDINF